LWHPVGGAIGCSARGAIQNQFISKRGMKTLVLFAIILLKFRIDFQGRAIEQVVVHGIKDNAPKVRKEDVGDGNAEKMTAAFQILVKRSSLSVCAVEGDAAVMMIDDDVGGAMIAIDARERFIAIIYIVYPVAATTGKLYFQTCPLTTLRKLMKSRRHSLLIQLIITARPSR
jgi:hypothetical protein